MYSFFTYTMMFLHTFVGLILVAIILLQRGRGGGLAGALGGMGGQSAFGNKAGDLFTKITVVLATVWIILGCVCVLLASNSGKQSEKIDKKIFATDVKEAAEDKGVGEKKDAEPGPGAPPATKTDTKSDVKPEGEKADAKTGAAADPKATKPDEAKPATTDKQDEKPADPKPEAKDEGANKDAKPEVKEEKPADPAKKPEGEAAAADKDSADKKPD